MTHTTQGRLAVPHAVIVTVLATVMLAAAALPLPARTKLQSPVEGMDGVELAIQEAGLPALAVQYRGLDISFAHYARYKVYAITGKMAIPGEDPVFTYLSMMFLPERWQNAKLFPVDHPQLARMLGVEFKSRLRPSDVSLPLENKLRAIVAFANAMPEERARTLIDLPAASAGVLSRDQFAGVFRRTLSVEARMRELRQMGQKLDVEMVRQWRATYFPEVDCPTLDWDSLPAETQKPLNTLYTNYLLGRVPQDRLVNYMVLMLGSYAPPAMMQALINDMVSVGMPDTSTRQAAMKLFGQVSAYHSLGEDFALVAIPGSLSGEWLTPMEAAQLESPVAQPTAELMQALLLAFRRNDTSELADATSAFRGAMEQVEGYTSSTRRWASHYYNTGHPFGAAMWFYLAGGVLLAVALSRAGSELADSVTRHASGTLYLAGVGAFLVGFAFHTLGIACRVIIMERAPVSNIWESIIWVVWGGVVFGAWMELRYRTIFAGMVTAVTGFVIMLTAHAMPDDMGQMQPLRAVLVSSWLTYHVLSITLSYAAFLLSAAFAVCLLWRDGSLFGWLPAGGGLLTRLGGTVLPSEATLELFVYRAIQIGYPLLTWGVFSGAVWADHAWGRFWAWDPKETWSLITWFVYTAFLHMRMRRGLAGRTMAWMSLAGFAAVLVTWLGVSYLPIFSGLHSYANG
jgi:cytochrome c-type biogenesis protein CcsB